MEIRALIIRYIQDIEVASWRKRLDARLPPLGFRLRFLITPCGFCVGRNGVWVGFPRVSLVILYQKFYSTTSPHSSIKFHYITSASWWCDRRGRPVHLLITDFQWLHRISSIDPVLFGLGLRTLYLNTLNKSNIISRVFCPRACLLLQTQESRLLFCSKADLPPQTPEPRLQFY